MPKLPRKKVTKTPMRASTSKVRNVGGTRARTSSSVAVPSAASRASSSNKSPKSKRDVAAAVSHALSALEAKSSRYERESQKRFGIVAADAYGVAMGDIQRIAKDVGRDHDVALALWESGHYEARLMCAYVDDPALVTPAQMDRWCRDFDNWGVCDTLCFSLFDRTPHAWKKVEAWRRSDREFVKRAAFALMASLALHDKDGDDRLYARALPWVEEAADDERNFVKKGVSWALRSTGCRGAVLHERALALSRRMAESPDPTTRWIGKDALKALTSPPTLRRVAARERRSKG